ncbi:19S proteasome regulatory subunit Mts4 [Schizosaccharomyces japonicus yFS275]|uniref:26S proteasome regulatory subunit RPN1 n=1 Tax=Schizosaccharomyces japonicus (strain yFS275 / FY16936) TaxID=402676 RepID=B6K4S6_SCHJY|nr:19S proteasome regulatory subunit Mts4 [Schizosaccharomyces japonicus yFS275]EEB08483.1 19S proteasome regulatory subunit Mts4 [Schizosaccharomyces japonicus yFS275]
MSNENKNINEDLKEKKQESEGSQKLKDSKDKKNDNSKQDEKEELSEEDLQLKNDLEMLVERIVEANPELIEAALVQLKDAIRTSTSSMTAVPKPLKFLRPHYPTLVNVYEKWEDGKQKTQLADILSVLGMTYSEPGKRESLKYRLQGVTSDPVSWGHEYVRHLAAEIGEEYSDRQQKELDTKDLYSLSMEIVPFFLNHNAEADAIDLLQEIEAIDRLPEFVEADNASRVCLYLTSCVNLLPFPEDVALLKTAHAIHRKFDRFTEALNISIRLASMSMIKDDFNAVTDPLVKKQMAFMLACQQIQMKCEDESLDEAIRNTRLSEFFHYLGKELNLMEPKLPEDIYKTHLDMPRSGLGSSSMFSAKQNLASTFVNAFVNAGFGADKLIMQNEEEASWIYKNKDTGMLTATASLGMLHLWDVEIGLSELDKYLYSTEENIKAGALLGIGLANVSVHNEADPAIAVLSEYLEMGSAKLRMSAIVGLGLAYAGSNREDLLDMLSPFVTDVSIGLQLPCLAALSLGLIFVGSCNGDVASIILQTLMEREPESQDSSWGRFMALGLALLFNGKQDLADATIETLRAIEGPIAEQARILVDICSYAGTGNVLKIQNLLHICSEPVPAEKEGETTVQSLAVLGVAIIAMGEDIGAEMVTRQFGHMMHYGEASIRKAVPLALGLLSASNPEMKIFDTLSRYSHDSDLDVAYNAIFSMGLVGAGTNNARLAQLLRQLANYYHKESNALFMVRIAQGLLHMGKGTVTVNPYHTDRQILGQTAFAGLLTVALGLLDAKTLMLDSSHWLFYYLALAMRPRMLLTLGEDGQPLPVSVRVGQAVDVVGQAGRPKVITGWVTHTTPVLLHHNERAELATESYTPLSTMEGIVILRKTTSDDMDVSA